jgi:hypothetical protein
MPYFTNSSMMIRNYISVFVKYTLILSLVEVTIDGVSNWIIGFIDTLYTILETTGNYSEAADLHNLQFTVTHALGSQSSLVLSWQPIFTQYLYQSHSNCSTHEVFFAV